MIYTVTLNPSLDRTLSVPEYRPGAVLRAAVLRRDFGGKGINVSRALRALGIPTRLIGFLGGPTGQAVQHGLTAEGFATSFHEIDGETRQNVTLLDESSGVYTRINEPGPRVRPGELAAMQVEVERIARRGDIWAFCDSLPPGAPPECYAGLVQAVQAHGGLAFLDTAGAPLRAGLAARPHGVKSDSEEAGEALGRPVTTDVEHVEAALALSEFGISVVCLSRGAQGLVLAMGSQVVIATAPPVQARSPIVAGDATLAGLLWAVSDGCDTATAARRAVACGTAAALQEGAGVGDRVLVEQLLSKVQVTTA